MTIDTIRNTNDGTAENPLLKGIRVLDLSRLLPGPFCSLNLAQLGAEVIKIEEPNGGDYTRSLMPELFTLVNRGKKSITLDLRESSDREQLLALVKTADVLLESFRPGVMDKLGCGYETLKAINPALVYASLTGYGHSGPYRDLAGHDMNYLATAGVLDQMGAAGGPPVLSNVQVADLAGGGLTCAMGILAAVIGASKSGQGAFVDVGMLDGSIALQQVALAELRSQGKSQARGEGMLTGELPNYRVYKCRDGRYLAVGALEPKFAIKLLTGLKDSVRDDLAANALLGSLPWFSKKTSAAGKQGKAKNQSSSASTAKQDALTAKLNNPTQARRWLVPAGIALAGIFRLRTADKWIELLARQDACIAKILTLEEAVQNEQVQARNLIETCGNGPAIKHPVQFVNAQTRSGVAPKLGEHNAEISSLANTER